MTRFFQENIGASSESMGGRRQPLQVRDLKAVALVRAIQLSWIGPANLAGIIGYNVYQGSETGPMLTVPAPQFPSSPKKGSNVSPNGSPVVRVTIPGLVTGVKTAFFVSCHTSILESVKLQVIAAAV